MSPTMRVFILILILCPSKYWSLQAIQIRGCNGTLSNPLVLIENQDTVITCEDIQGTDSTVSWTRVLESNLSAGDCYSNLHCDDRNPTFATLSRPSYSTSTMTLRNVSRAVYANNQVKCFTFVPPSPVEVSGYTCYMNVIYPPSTPPVITGYTGQAVNENQTLTMNCTVAGGNPPVTSVTFGCGGQGQTSNGTSKVLIVTSDYSRDGQRCECSANWENKTPAWYTQTASVTLNVNYGPNSVSLFGLSDPGVFDLHPTNPSQLTLTCSASSFKPNVIYKWSGACVSSTTSTCSFTPRASNNGDVINCTAINTVTNVQKTSYSRIMTIHCICIPSTEPNPYQNTRTLVTPSAEVNLYQNLPKVNTKSTPVQPPKESSPYQNVRALKKHKKKNDPKLSPSQEYAPAPCYQNSGVLQNKSPLYQNV